MKQNPLFFRGNDVFQGVLLCIFFISSIVYYIAFFRQYISCRRYSFAFSAKDGLCALREEMKRYCVFKPISFQSGKKS
jgi:hypothetical protein